MNIGEITTTSVQEVDSGSDQNDHDPISTSDYLEMLLSKKKIPRTVEYKAPRGYQTQIKLNAPLEKKKIVTSPALNLDDSSPKVSRKKPNF